MNDKDRELAEMKVKVYRAAEYLKNGDPLKDVMDDYDVAKAIELLAKLLKERKP